jgi:hypothetical protein
MTRVLEELAELTGYVGALVLAALDPMTGDIKTMT